MPFFPFSQVNVFSSDPLGGNPLAVVHAAETLTEETMAALARWTNLSETAFLLPPTHPEADYRVRIFCPTRELLFAGHPTLGACHAWLSEGHAPPDGRLVIQECGIGLVPVRYDNPRLEFAAPALLRTGPLEAGVLGKIAEAFALQPEDILAHQWVDNGPGWCALMLRSARCVLSATYDKEKLRPLNVGLVGPHDTNCDAAFEVRAFTDGGYEDPVTGSLNASLAQWLFREGFAKNAYTAAQGTLLQRSGRIYLRQENGQVWVGGEVRTVVTGSMSV